jgi:alkyl hydroperoxide reductase subunit F
LTAAIYCRRKQLQTAIVSPAVGGATALSNWVENYPGVKPMSGMELMGQFKAGAVSLDAALVAAQVTAIRVGSPFRLELNTNGHISARAIIVSCGKVPRRLGVPGEDKFFGRGVSTCATCDGPLFKGKTVAIVGGGNAAVEAALELSAIAKKTYLVHRRESFRADEITVSKLGQTPVELLLNHEVVKITGEKFITAATIRRVDTAALRELEIDGLFLEIGADADAALVAPFRRNAQNEIIVDDRQRTNVRGAFAAGDVTTVAYKQTVISAGAGATAALEAHRFLTSPDYRWPADGKA